MLASLYSKALELFGKAFLVSAFVPVIAVFVLLSLSTAPEWSIRTLTEWSAEKLTAQTARAVLLLIALYLFAFIVYGMRDQITRFIAGGHFWLLEDIRKARRRHFIDRIREGDLKEAMSLALPQATVWAEKGFGAVHKDDVYVPMNTDLRKLRRQIENRLKQIEKAVRKGKLTADVTTRWLNPLSDLYIALHQHALLGDAAPHTRAPDGSLQKVTK